MPVAIPNTRLWNVDEPFTSKFPSVARFETTSCEVEAVFVTPRKVEVAFRVTRLSDTVVEAKRLVVVAVETVRNPDPVIPIWRRLATESKKSPFASSTAVPSAV